MGFPGAPLLLVGGGKMGEALLQGWLGQGLDVADAQVIETDATRREYMEQTHGVLPVAAASALPEGFRPATIVLAIKPQMMDEALPATSSEACGFRNAALPPRGAALPGA